MKATCAICKTEVERTLQHFPMRKAPYNKPFMATLYFRDPFFGYSFEEYCGPKCSAVGHTQKENADEKTEATQENSQSGATVS